MDTCLYCNQKLIQPSGSGRLKKYCNDSCRRKFLRKADKLKTYLKFCPQCLRTFETTNKPQKYCSIKCNTDNQRLQAFEKAKSKEIPLHVYRNKKSRDKFFRNQRIANAFVEHVDLAVLIERDKGICQLCNKPVFISENKNDLLYPTNDHVIPLSQGGEHSYANCQLAHRECNTAKNNRIEVDSLGQTKQKRESSY